MEISDSQSSNRELKEYCRELRKKINLNNKILLINCPQFNLDSFDLETAKNRGYYAYPPTGLQYLASAIDKKNLEVRILDLNFEFLKKVQTDESFNPKNWTNILKDYIKEYEASIVGISDFYWVDFPAFKEASQFLRKSKDKPIILAGGDYATHHAEEFLQDDLCDFVCQRESENKINFLLNSLYDKKGNTKPTPGILFIHKGKLEESKGERDLVELKGNLIDIHKMIKTEEYCKVGSLCPFSRMVGKDIPYATLILNRGCRGNCKFCGVRDYMGIGVRSRSTKDVLDEIEYLYKERGVRHIDWLDDDFTRYNEKTLELLQGIIDRKIKISWSINNGIIASGVDEQLMTQMRDSGCVGFHVGVESGNPSILKDIRKLGTTKSFLDFSRISQKFPEMFIIDNYILGFPGETFEQIMNTFRFSQEMNMDWSSYSIYQPNRGIDFEKNSSGKEERIIEDFVPSKYTEKTRLERKENVLEGKGIFGLFDKEVPSREQLKEIWFGFDLIRNLILNKNLKPDGNPEKFVRWINSLQDRYPLQPQLSLFNALTSRLIGDEEQTESQYELTKRNLRDEYWKRRFNQFGLTDVLDNFPGNQHQTREALEYLKKENEK